MKCNCGQGREAEYTIVGDDFVQVYCRRCFLELIVLLEDVEEDFLKVSITGKDAERFLKTVNEKLLYHKNQYGRLLKEYSKLKKQLKKEAESLEAIKKIIPAFPEPVGLYSENFEKEYSNFVEEYTICLEDLRAAIKECTKEEAQE